MKKTGKTYFSKRVVFYEVFFILFAIAVIWLDEIVDIPNLLLNAPPTKINWKEALFESLFIFLFGALIIRITMKLFKRMKYLEGILPICASCKKIRDDKGSWQYVEEYVRDRSEAEFSHGICPECKKKLYPEFTNS